MKDVLQELANTNTNTSHSYTSIEHYDPQQQLKH